MRSVAIELLEQAADDFSGLDPAPLFFGAAIVPLYIDDEAALSVVTTTEDVDLVVRVGGQAFDRDLSSALREHGFRRGQRPGRWHRRRHRYDVLPDTRIPADDWAHPDKARWVEHVLPSGARILAMSYWSPTAMPVSSRLSPRPNLRSDSCARGPSATIRKG